MVHAAIDVPNGPGPCHQIGPPSQGSATAGASQTMAPLTAQGIGDPNRGQCRRCGGDPAGPAAAQSLRCTTSASKRRASRAGPWVLPCFALPRPPPQWWGVPPGPSSRAAVVC